MSEKKGRHYRGYRYPLPIDGYPLIDVCFQIPDAPEYRAAVRGALHLLTQYYSWWNEVSGADLQQRWDVGRIFLNLLNDTLVFGDCMTDQLQVRTNPDNACILEYSPDAGLNWFTFADMTDCQALAGDSWEQTVIINNNRGDIYNINYDGTTTSININAPVTTWNESGAPGRNEALCMATMSLVGTICAMEVQALEARYVGSAVIFALAFVLTGGVAAFGIILVGSLIAGYGYTVSRAALEDRSAQLDVACCMLDGLTGQPVTLTALQNSLSACGFTVGSNAAIVRDYVDRTCQYERTYLALLDVCGQTYIQATVLGLNLCECGDCGICTFDNPLSDLAYSVLYGTVGGDGNPAQCLHGIEFTGPPPNTYRIRQKTLFDLPAPMTVDKVSWDIYIKKPAAAGSNYSMTVKLFDSLMVEQASWFAVHAFTAETWISDNVSDVGVPNISFVEVETRLVTSFVGAKEMRVDNVRVFCI